MEEHTADDQSHYEISLTAGQAFIAFVLLLLSLAASFAFGLMLGKGQADDRLVVQKETPVVTEAATLPAKKTGEIVELGVRSDDFAPADDEEAAPATEPAAATETAAVEPAEIVETPAPAETPAAEPVKPAAEPAKPAATVAHAPAPQAHAPAPKVPYLAQLLSTGDQKTAEALAVKLIDRGFNTAFVERGSTEKGAVYRVRVRFDSEQEARANEPKLREFSKDVWITAR
jgi:cell division septation protein DedD